MKLLEIKTHIAYVFFYYLSDSLNEIKVQVAKFKAFILMLLLSLQQNEIFLNGYECMKKQMTNMINLLKNHIIEQYEIINFF